MEFKKGDYVASRIILSWLTVSVLWEVAVVVAFCCGWAKKIGLVLGTGFVSLPGSIFFYPLLFFMAVGVVMFPLLFLSDLLINIKLKQLGEI